MRSPHLFPFDSDKGTAAAAGNVITELLRVLDIPRDGADTLDTGYAQSKDLPLFLKGRGAAQGDPRRISLSLTVCIIGELLIENQTLD